MVSEKFKNFLETVIEVKLNFIIQNKMYNINIH